MVVTAFEAMASMRKLHQNIKGEITHTLNIESFEKWFDKTTNYLRIGKWECDRGLLVI